MDEEFWKTVRVRRRATYRSGRTGALNIALLFGTAVIAFSLIITPMLIEDKDARRLAHVHEEFDRITTGSVPRVDDRSKHYTIRRSILQETPGSVCIIERYDVGARC